VKPAAHSRPRATGTKQPGQPDSFLMPAEWEPHAATWLAWPHNRSDWPGKYEPIPWVYAEIIRHLVSSEPVHLIVTAGIEERRARTVLTRAHVPLKNVTFHRWRTDRGWTRDSGAIFVRSHLCQENESALARKKNVALSWRFNAWAKYSDWKFDSKIAPKMARCLGVDCVAPVEGRRRLVLEGGAIDVNGCGTLLTTEECLLSPNVQVRNPGICRAELEAAFHRYLGVQNVIWLKLGIAGDDTHGHIDDIARFVSPGTIVAAVETNKDDPNYEPLRQNLDVLRAATDQEGRSIRVVKLPMPAPVIFRGRRLPASYANFYIANRVVLVPTFNDPTDRIALGTLAKLFPERNVTGIYCGDLVWGLGAVHCMTQQQPA
jgi:agmatine deiminase